MFSFQSIKRNKQLPARSVSIEIYSGIARFPCNGTAVFVPATVLLYTRLRLCVLEAGRLRLSSAGLTSKHGRYAFVYGPRLERNDMWPIC